MSQGQAPIILVDGSSYLYRAFHALPPLTTSKGQPTGAIKGVMNMLRRHQNENPDSPLVVVFDAKGKTFRDDMFEQYKANRPPMPDDLREQIQPLHDLIDALGLPRLVIEGVEADDVIGTLAIEAQSKGLPVIISTGDKDMAQLVRPGVTLMNTMSDTIMDEDGVVEKFGIPPNLIIDFLALMGDKVDNIPGVPGVGQKTALALLQGIGSIEDIYQNLDKIADLNVRGAKSLGAKMEAHKAEADMSYQLATIKTDVALDFAVEELQQREQDKAKLRELYAELEFKTQLREIDSEGGAESPAAAAPSAVEKHYETVATREQLDKWIGWLNQAPLFAFDTETTSLNYHQAQLVGISVSHEAGKAAYIPVGHADTAAPEQLPLETVLEAFKPLLESSTKKIVGQNLKYDMHILANYGITVNALAHDTMLESYVFDSTATRHDMDSLASKYLSHTTIHYEDVAGKGAKQITFDQVGIEQASEYAAEDADITLRLHEALFPQLSEKASPLSVYNDIELPLVPVLQRMEQQGVLLDINALAQQSQELAQDIDAFERKAHDLAGQVFNLGSPKQLQAILFEGENPLPVISKTPKGQPSTAESVLQELAHEHELPEVILQYRHLSKLKSTYTDKLPGDVSPKSGRIHTSYHQAVAATGRLSSSDPNLQNIPVKSEQGRAIRKAFIAPEGSTIIAADYSQVELRIMAHLSEDPRLLDAFKHGEDIHTATAAEVFGLTPMEVASEHRRAAKAINFGLIYGMSAFGLAKQLKISRPEAQEYVNAYFERYPGVKDYMERIKAKAKEDGFVETVFGRRLYLPEIHSRNAQRRQYAERTAINAPMQGTAADIIKRAMITIDKRLYGNGEDFGGSKMIMQVHDELVFEVPNDQVENIKQLVREEMPNAADLKVPLVVDVGLGSNWEEAH